MENQEVQMRGHRGASTVDRAGDGLWVMRGIPEQPLLLEPE